MNNFNNSILMSEESIPVYNLHGKQITSIPRTELKKIMLPKQNNQTLFKPVPINPNSLSPVPIFPNANIEKKIEESKPKKNVVEFEGKFKDIKIGNIIIKEFEGKIKK